VSLADFFRRLVKPKGVGSAAVRATVTLPDGRVYCLTRTGVSPVTPKPARTAP
jgi:hypothetical protein